MIIGAGSLSMRVVPLTITIVLFAVPFISNKGERSLRRRPWTIGIVIFLLSSFAALLVEGIYEHWTPKFSAKPLTQDDIGAASGPVYAGAQVFDKRGCIFCHTISGHGGKRGPDLTEVGNRLTHDQIIIRIMNGGINMPAYGSNMTPHELESLAAFLESRKPGQIH